MKGLTVRIEGEPVAQGRPRFSRFSRGRPLAVPRAFDPTASREWKRAARIRFVLAIQESGAERPFAREGPVEVRVLAVFPCPVADHRKTIPAQRRPHAKRPDGENVAKAVLDAGTGVLWTDDSQVSDLHVHKRIGAQGEAPYVEVTVEPLA